MTEQNHDYSQYIDELSDVDLCLPPSTLALFSHVMGFDISQPASPDQIARAQRWIHGSQKRWLERSLCQFIGSFGGRAIARLGERAIHRRDGGDGLITLNVGFLGSNGPILHPLQKIRTMTPGAAEALTSSFQHASFIGEKGKRDTRILPSRYARLLRRTALDEMPQICYQVPAGELAEKLNISRAHMGHIEQGRKKPSLDLLEDIAKVLRVKVKDIFPF